MIYIKMNILLHYKNLFNMKLRIKNIIFSMYYDVSRCDNDDPHEI